MEENETPQERQNPLEEILKSLRERDEQRRQAIDMAWQQLSAAQSDQEKTAALDNIARMLGVSEEFHSQFPEVFPPEEDE